MSNSAFSPSVLTVPSGTTGSGQGELNLITNPVAASDTTGWSPATGRGTSGGPLSPTIDTYFTVLNTAGSESSTSGAYGVISLPSGLQNKKLKVEFYFTSPALDTFNVSVYKGTTRVPLTTDVSGSTALPQNTTGKFVAYFDTDSSGTWTLSITRTAGTGATALQFTNVVVGPGIQPQGAVVGEWQSYTGTVQNGGTATFTYSSRQWRRIGDSLELDYEFQVSANGSGSSFIYMPLPAGLSVDFVKAPSSTVLGSGFSILGSTMDSTRLPRTITGLQGVGIYVSTGALQGSGLVSGTNFAVKAMVPIAEWAGSGTVQLAQNDTSFAADDGTNDVFGPSGAAVPTIGLGTGVTTRSFTYQEPLQQQDNFRVEFQFAVGEAWYPAEYHFPWLQTAATDYYGLSLMQTGSSVMITFGNRGGRPSAGIGSNGLAWNTAWRWRVRKSSAGAAVGFGIVRPGVSSGLVSAAGLPGNTTGNVVAAGYVGEIISASLSNVPLTSTVPANAGTLTLQPGIWTVFYKGTLDANSFSTHTSTRCSISTTSATHDATSNVLDLSTSTSSEHCPGTCVKTINVTTANFPVYGVITGVFSGTVPISRAAYSQLYAIRIA